MTVAGDLVRAFANVPKMAAMYAPEIVWTLPKSVDAITGSPLIGIANVTAFNNAVWGVHHSPDNVVVTVHAELEQGDLSACRFRYEADMLSNGRRYVGEYTLFATVNAEGKIIEVHEGLDTLLVSKVMAGEDV